MKQLPELEMTHVHEPATDGVEVLRDVVGILLGDEEREGDEAA